MANRKTDKLANLRTRMRQSASPKKALILSRFFKTGKGQYGEGDVFIGLSVPEIRVLAKDFADLSLAELKHLLCSRIHEERTLALVFLVNMFENGSRAEKKTVFEFYLRNFSGVNNWDLVDISAYKIVGEYLRLEKKDVSFLRKMACSANLWERRAAIVSTFAFIRKGSSAEIFSVGEILACDKSDLIQKALGWMLREVGKKLGVEEEEKFLKRWKKEIGRTALRYAIERFPEKIRRVYLAKSQRRRRSFFKSV